MNLDIDLQRIETVDVNTGETGMVYELFIDSTSLRYETKQQAARAAQAIKRALSKSCNVSE